MQLALQVGAVLSLEVEFAATQAAQIDSVVSCVQGCADELASGNPFPSPSALATPGMEINAVQEPCDMVTQQQLAKWLVRRQHWRQDIAIPQCLTTDVMVASGEGRCSYNANQQGSNQGSNGPCCQPVNLIDFHHPMSKTSRSSVGAF
jgi:hypothetical protein